MLILHVLAQSQQTDVPGWLAQQGPLGIAVLVLGWFGAFMFRRLLKERDELAGQRETMIATLLKVVPIIERSTELIEQRKQIDERHEAVLREVTEVMRDCKRELGR